MVHTLLSREKFKFIFRSEKSGLSSILFFLKVFFRKRMKVGRCWGVQLLIFYTVVFWQAGDSSGTRSAFLLSIVLRMVYSREECESCCLDSIASRDYKESHCWQITGEWGVFRFLKLATGPEIQDCLWSYLNWMPLCV